MWQVGVVFAALASFSGAAGDALVRLSFVLEAKRRRKQRQLLLLRQLQRASSTSRSCRAVVSTSRGCTSRSNNSSSPNSSSSSPRSSSFSSGECGSGSRVEEKQAPSDTTGDDEKNNRRCTSADGEATWKYDNGKEEDEAGPADKDVAVYDDAGEAQGIFIPSRPFYLRPLWLLGTCLGTVINTLLSIVSLDFASAAVVTPFAGLHIFWNVIFSRFILQERVFTQHYVGSALVLFGLFFVLCYGVHTPPTLSLQQLLRLYSQNSCVIYFCLSALALFPCVYIGLFGKDIGLQHQPGQQREQQQQEQHRLPAQQHRRTKVLPYHAVGGDDFSGGLDAEESGVDLNSSRGGREGAHERTNGVPPAARKPVVSCRRRSGVARARSAMRHSTALSLVKKNEDGELEGLSGRLCEALPEGGRSFSSFSCEDDASVCSASDGESCSVRELLDVAAAGTTVGGPSARAARHRSLAAVESETHTATRDDNAAEELRSERTEGFSRHPPMSGKDSVDDAVGGGALPSCSDTPTPRKEVTATHASLQFDKPSAYAPRGRQKCVEQTNSGRLVEGAGAARRQHQEEKTAMKSENQRCLQHIENNSSCLAIEISGAEEKARDSLAIITSDNTISWEDVESGDSTGHHRRQKQQQQQQQGLLQTQQQETGGWRDSLPAALYVEVPVALRRFCIAAASGACGGNTNIIMEHVMDVWHTESFASLLHPKFFLLLLLLGLMALGQLVFLNLGLARYEALYVVPTTMSVLIISSCLGEISVFIHVLELSQKEFFIFAGGALSIVSGIMVLSAADMERQQESSTVERLKEEDEQQSTVETDTFEESPDTPEKLSCRNLAEANKQRAFLSAPLPEERHTSQERCSTTSTKCSRTNFSNPDGTHTAGAVAKRSSSGAEAAVERVDVAGKKGSKLDVTLQQKACVETSSQVKTIEGRKERRKERSLFRSQRRLARSSNRAPGRVSDAGVELYSSAHLSTSDSQTLTGTVTPAQPSSSHSAAGVAAASHSSAVARVPRSPTVGLLAAAAAVPQVLFSRLVRGSSRVVASSDTNQHSSGRNRLRSRYQRLTRSDYSCAAVQASEEETCEVHPNRSGEKKSFSHLLADPESGCCTCQPDNANSQETHAAEEQFVNTPSSNVC